MSSEPPAYRAGYGAMYINHDKPLLTALRSEVRKRQLRLTEISASVQSLQQEAANLSRWLEAAKVIMGELPDGDEEQPLSRDGTALLTLDTASEQSFSDLVLRAVRAMGGAPKPADIKQWVLTNVDVPSVKEAVGKQYFYTVLMRHARKGQLIKEGAGYRLPHGSPQGEAGGVAPPASRNP